MANQRLNELFASSKALDEPKIERDKAAASRYNNLKEYFTKPSTCTIKNLVHEKVEKQPVHQFSNFSDLNLESDFAFEYKGSFSHKQSSQLNLMTDNSENINDETDVCLNLSNIAEGRKVSFADQENFTESDFRAEYD